MGQVCRGSVLGGTSFRPGLRQVPHADASPVGRAELADARLDIVGNPSARIGARNGKEHGEPGEDTATLKHLTSREPEVRDALGLCCSRQLTAKDEPHDFVDCRRGRR